MFRALAIFILLVVLISASSCTKQFGVIDKSLPAKDSTFIAMDLQTRVERIVRAPGNGDVQTFFICGANNGEYVCSLEGQSYNMAQLDSVLRITPPYSRIYQQKELSENTFAVWIIGSMVAFLGTSVWVLTSSENPIAVGSFAVSVAMFSGSLIFANSEPTVEAAMSYEKEINERLRTQRTHFVDSMVNVRASEIANARQNDRWAEAWIRANQKLQFFHEVSSVHIAEYSFDIRKGPDTELPQLLHTLEKGMPFVLLGITKDGWGKIRDWDGVTGWIYFPNSSIEVTFEDANQVYQVILQDRKKEQKSRDSLEREMRLEDARIAQLEAEQKQREDDEREERRLKKKREDDRRSAEEWQQLYAHVASGEVLNTPGNNEGRRFQQWTNQVIRDELAQNGSIPSSTSNSMTENYSSTGEVGNVVVYSRSSSSFNTQGSFLSSSSSKANTNVQTKSNVSSSSTKKTEPAWLYCFRNSKFNQHFCYGFYNFTTSYGNLKDALQYGGCRQENAQLDPSTQQMGEGVHEGVWYRCPSATVRPSDRTRAEIETYIAEQN